MEELDEVAEETIRSPADFFEVGNPVNPAAVYFSGAHGAQSCIAGKFVKEAVSIDWTVVKKNPKIGLSGLVKHSFKGECEAARVPVGSECISSVGILIDASDATLSSGHIPYVAGTAVWEHAAGDFRLGSLSFQTAVASFDKGKE